MKSNAAVAPGGKLAQSAASAAAQGERMPSLRERQRERRQQAMLAAAAELFRQNGFAKTTMDNIAEGAEVGIATVYNYFGTKENILTELFRPYLDRSHEEAERVIASPPEQPAKGVTEVLRCYRHLQEEWDNRALLRSFAAAGFGSSGLLHDLIAETDRNLRRQILSLLKLYASKGMVSVSLDLDAATSIIFALFNQFYYQFLQTDDVPYERTFSGFASLLPTLFAAWETRSV